jgi:hypothetical protein
VRAPGGRRRWWLMSRGLGCNRVWLHRLGGK